MALVTLERAKMHLRVDHSDEDVVISEMADDATAIVVDYIKRPDHDWTDETVPGQVRSSILLVLSSLYEHRGGGEKDDHLSPTVVALLHRLRDPAIA